MGIAVLVWQLIIFLTIYFCGRKRRWAAGFWVVWTLFQVYTLPLSFLQFFTIWLAYTMAGSKVKKPE